MADVQTQDYMPKSAINNRHSQFTIHYLLLTIHYSHRSATVGSTLVARCAGR
jgi:hypothetical protein